MHRANDMPQQFPVRYWALKLLEQDKEAEKQLEDCFEFPRWKKMAANAAKKIQMQVGVDVETAISGAKYGFVSGALHETYKAGDKDAQKQTKLIDRLVANRWLGFPIFILVMWIMFSTVFIAGAYPQEWIENIFAWMGDFVSGIMPQCSRWRESKSRANVP